MGIAFTFPLNPTVKRFAALFALPATFLLGIAGLASKASAQADAAAGGGSGHAPSSGGQTPTSGGQPPGTVSLVNRNVVVLDPAHGGPDSGATLGERLLEKDVTLALAARLKTALVAAGFTVVLTRDSDSLAVLPADQRAETANRVRAAACLVIHATGAGNGVHLYGSTLEAKEPDVVTDAEGDLRPVFEPVPWDSAQAEWVGRSLRMQGEMGAALGKAGIPAVQGRAPVRPLDNMVCPALAVEVAPLGAGDSAKPVTDPEYQQRLADTVAAALKQWRTEISGAASGSAAPGEKP